MTDEVTGRALATVPVRAWSADGVLEVDQVLTAGDFGSDGPGRMSLVATVLGGVVDDGRELPREIPLEGAPLDAEGDEIHLVEGRPHELGVMHPTTCDGEACHVRYRVRVLRPDDLPAHLGMEVRLSLAGHVGDTTNEPSIPAAAEVDLDVTVLSDDAPLPAPPEPTSPADLTVSLPRPDGLADLPESVTFERPRPRRSAPVLVSVTGDAVGTVVLDHMHGERSFRIAIGESLAMDPFDDLDRDNAHTDSYNVHLERSGPAGQLGGSATVEIRVPEGVAVGRGSLGAPSAERLGFRWTDSVAVTTEGTIDLPPSTSRHVVSHVLEVSDSGVPFTGSLVISIGASATYHPPEGQPDVLVQLVDPSHVRRLTPTNAYKAVGRYLAVEVVDGVAQPPIDLTFTRQADGDTSIRWDLKVFLDPLRNDTPRDVEATLVRADP